MKKLNSDSAENLAKLCADKRKKIFLCIGDPSHMWDSYGPMVGSLLSQEENILCFGNVENPVNANNIELTVKAIKHAHPNDIIVAIDAALTCDPSKEGNVNIHDYGVIPGGAFDRGLDRVGDYSILYGVDRDDINNRLMKKPFLAALETYQVIKASILNDK